jgi:hypothetical protein
MPGIESKDPLLPYLNPEYWDGHSLGYGEPVAPLSMEPVLKQVMFILESSRRERQLLDRISLMHRAVPVQSFTDGEVFDPEAHETGTLVIFRKEFLSGDPAMMEADAESLTDQPVPARPLDLSPNFAFGPATETVRSGVGLYATNARWGIVSTSITRSHKVLFTASTGGIHKRQHGGEARTTVLALNMIDHPIEVGATDHHVTHDKREILERVNALDLVAYGQEERKKRWIGGLAAKLAPGRST